ncbi:MAG: hypothetical protein AAF304_01320 [Pseudomonadota bacterium]
MYQEIHSKKLSEIDNDFERGVFLASYNSLKQRRNRFFAGSLLSIKHGVRGILFSWPLYLLPLASLALPDQFKILFVVLLLPGIYVSSIILKRGVKEDYQNLINERLIKLKHLRHLCL